MGRRYESSLVKKVVDQLSSDIVSGNYEGNVLPAQAMLSRQYGVSLTIMREAMSILSSRGMLDVKQKTGTRIKPVEDWIIFDYEVMEWRMSAARDLEYVRTLIELRDFVDPKAAYIAATRANRHQRIAIAAAFQKLVQAAPSLVSWANLEDALRTAIIEASGNTLLRQMSRIIQAGMRVYPTVPTQMLEPAMCLAHYRGIVRAIEEHDADGAKSAMASLVTDVAKQQA